MPLPCKTAMVNPCLIPSNPIFLTYGSLLFPVTPGPITSIFDTFEVFAQSIDINPPSGKVKNSVSYKISSQKTDLVGMFPNVPSKNA